ncbi:hypothetical protein FA13DRAFT_1741966 [Coprinellus micaceus]|uniref:Uncharacterized protein n=1 Tax=Coprinellus micaceus TaxID=71717 RepID=A0A4Y7SJK0_COPMI|nr:hypothetical protein FA13DRAFT_1741966 [Coprinellus micaceus]
MWSPPFGLCHRPLAYCSYPHSPDTPGKCRTADLQPLLATSVDVQLSQVSPECEGMAHRPLHTDRMWTWSPSEPR